LCPPFNGSTAQRLIAAVSFPVAFFDRITGFYAATRSGGFFVPRNRGWDNLSPPDAGTTCVPLAHYPGTLTQRTYKAIYRVGDRQVGPWSGDVSVIVGG